MSKKKKRQRGSRTHGTGSQKNHRGAGNRGGRGAAGRKDHEKQLHGPLGKAGFTRPEDAALDVETVNARELDEDVPLLLSAGDAEETDDGIAVDARDVVDDGHEVDAVKLLGGGQVHESLVVTADDFSESAREAIEAAGGTARLSERGRRLREERAAAETEKDSHETRDG
ncbi:50S ribosomal protein L15 [Halobacteriales archaeon SW_5_70_135]|nr:MAG: 50S ribosomal protein L15 [Halobacteriales archaeon SW_5_70_135]